MTGQSEVGVCIQVCGLSERTSRCAMGWRIKEKLGRAAAALQEVPPPGHLQVASLGGLEPVQHEHESYSVCV